MKFKVGDKVRVRRIYEEEHKDCVGATGVVTYVDPDWIYPYELEFDEHERYYSKDLFLEVELELYEEEVDEPSISEVMDDLLLKLKKLHNDGGNGGMNHYLTVNNAIARLTEAKMWVDKLDKE